MIGFDASKWQGGITWDDIAKDNVDFAILRATYNSAVVDSKFAEYLSECKRIGLSRGAYHFFVPTDKAGALAQLEFFTKTVNLDDLNLPVPPGVAPVALDVEKDRGLNDAQITELVLAWCEGFEQKTGLKPMIYSYPWFIQTYLTDPRLSLYPLWIADYHKGNVQLPIGAWSSYYIRQTTDKGHLEGISGNVDLDEMEVPELTKEDANEIIAILQEQFRQGVTKLHLADGSVKTIDQAEIHRLANVCRTSSGQPVQS